MGIERTHTHAQTHIQTHAHTHTHTHTQGTHLDPVLDLAGVVVDDEGGLHDGGELDVAVSVVLPSELVQ